MTATQVLFLFLKTECSIDEMRFFKYCIIKDPQNKYFRKRPLYKATFVEDYLSNNNRALNNFMTRLFILAPSLINRCDHNPRWRIIWKSYNERNIDKFYRVAARDWRGEKTGKFDIVPCQFQFYRKGMYIEYYKRKWNNFLKEMIVSDKKFNSPFKKGEHYEFKFKTDVKNETY